MKKLFKKILGIKEEGEQCSCSPKTTNIEDLIIMIENLPLLTKKDYATIMKMLRKKVK